MDTNQNGMIETKLCKYCKTPIHKKAKYCPNCRKKQKSPVFKIVVITLVVIVLLMSCIGGKSDSSTTGTVEKTEDVKTTTATQTDEKKEIEVVKTEEKEQDQSNVIKAGEYYENDGLKMIINETSDNYTDYEDEYGFHTPKDGMKYVMISFTYENNGDSDKYIDIYNDCYADNTQCEQEYGLDNDNFVNTNLSSGRNVSFKTYYQVPVDANSIELEIKESFWSDKKIIVKIK